MTALAADLWRLVQALGIVSSSGPSQRQWAVALGGDVIPRLSFKNVPSALMGSAPMEGPRSLETVELISVLLLGWPGSQGFKQQGGALFSISREVTLSLGAGASHWRRLCSSPTCRSPRDFIHNSQKSGPFPDLTSGPMVGGTNGTEFTDGTSHQGAARPPLVASLGQNFLGVGGVFQTSRGRLNLSRPYAARDPTAF